MSWFDGRIPPSCSACFSCIDGRWLLKEEVQWDDRCDFFLEMFPVFRTDGSIDSEKMNVLSVADSDPAWTLSL